MIDGPIQFRKVATLFCCMAIAICITHTASWAQPYPDFSSPRVTIETYHRAMEKEDRETVENSFYPTARFGEVGKFWHYYKIVEMKEVAEGDNRFWNMSYDAKELIEAIVEKKQIHPQRNNPIAKFWYLLKKIGMDWKIVSHAYIPDKNYPPMDSGDCQPIDPDLYRGLKLNHSC